MDNAKFNNAVNKVGETIREGSWGALAWGAGVTAASIWIEVVLDEVVEPRAEIIAGGLTAATVAFAGMARRERHSQAGEHISE